MSFDVIVAGGGFAGIYAAWRLARDGAKVAFVEAAPHIGGNLMSREWNGYWLDNGAHNFDMRTPLGAQFYPDILGDNLQVFTDQQWAATSDKTWVPGFELPSFDDDPEFCQAALAELEERRNLNPAPQETFVDQYRQKFGNLIANRVLPMIEKFTGSDPSTFAVEAAGALGLFSRIRLGSDSEMIALKSDAPYWDERLGVSHYCKDERFIGLNSNREYAYPARKGLTGYCDAAHQRLSELGVDIRTECPITDITDQGEMIEVHTPNGPLAAKHVFWSMPDTILAKVLDIDVDLMSSAVPVGTAFFAFEVLADSIQGPDYLHDFSDRIAFRLNKAGVYGKQIKPDGYTYVVAEVPGHPARLGEMATMENRSRAWNGFLDTGYLAPGTKARNAHHWIHPVAFTIPKVGWKDAHDRAKCAFAEVSPRLSGIDFGYRGRNAFMMFYENILQHRIGKLNE